MTIFDRTLDDLVVGVLDEENNEPYDEDRKAIEVLSQCADLYKNKLTAKAKDASVEVLKEISELYHVPPPLIYHSVKYGPRNAHSTYKANKKEEKKEG